MTTTTCARCDDRGWNLRDARIDVCECGVYDPPKWVTRGDTACVIGHQREAGRPRRAAVGYTCAGHQAGIERLIAELPALFDDLGLVLTSSECLGSDRVRSSREPGLNLNRAVVDTRDEIQAELVRMVREAVEDTDDELPSNDRPTTLATWLLGHLDWFCQQLSVDETHANLTRLTSACRRLAYPVGIHKIEIGPCGDGDCPGTLWLRGAEDESRTMTCDDCSRVVEPRYWRAERRRIDGVDVNPWLTLTEAAVQYGTTTRTIERWVAKGRLKARGTPMRVKASAVEALMQAHLDTLRASA